MLGLLWLQSLPLWRVIHNSIFRSVILTSAEDEDTLMKINSREKRRLGLDTKNSDLTFRKCIDFGVSVSLEPENQEPQSISLHCVCK